MKMTDRELFELAAKAAGIEIDKAFNPGLYNDTVIPFGTLVTLNDKGGHTLWNPLTDDGDALRLAVKLANTNDNFHSITWNWTHREIRVFADAAEGYGDDPYEATRRAIVRAAAEIGKAMK